MLRPGGAVVFGPENNANGYNRGGAPGDNATWGGTGGLVNYENFPSTVPQEGPVSHTFDVSSLNFDGSSSAFYWVTYRAGAYAGTITLVGLSEASTSVPDGGATLALMGLGLLGVGAWRRRKA